MIPIFLVMLEALFQTGNNFCASHEGRKLSVSGQPSPNNFSILYFNARSILPKLDDLWVAVAAQKPSIVCIVESWLSEDISDLEMSIENYHLTRLDRNRHGGGVVIYIHASLTWEVLFRGANDLEFLSLSITSAGSLCKHCVSVLYRPPSSPVSFFDNLCTTLQFLSPHRFTSFVLVGDLTLTFVTKTTPIFVDFRVYSSLFQCHKLYIPLPT